MRLLLLPFLCLVLPCSLWAQGNLSIDRIGVAQGLSQGYITCMAQDREGFVWAGTVNGLNRFDGRGFRFFKNDPFDSLTLPNSTILTLCDTADFLLVGTENSGLSIFHKKTERVFRVPFSPVAKGEAGFSGPGEVGKVPGSDILALLFDEKGSLWLAVSETTAPYYWVCKMDFPDGFWKKLPEQPHLAQHLVCRRWWCEPNEQAVENWRYSNYLFQAKPAGSVVCNRRQQAMLFDPNRQRWEAFSPPAALSGKIMPAAFSKKGGDSFWYNVEGEVWHFDGVARWAKTNLAGGLVLGFDQKYVWTRTQNAIKVFEAAQEVGKTDFSNPRWQFAVQDERHISFTDQSGNFWWAEGVQGILKFSPQSNRFRCFLPGESVRIPLFETAQGLVPCDALDLGGLFFLDKKTGEKVAVGRPGDFRDLVNGTVVPGEGGCVWSLFGKKEVGDVVLVKTDLKSGISRRLYLPFDLYRRNMLVPEPNGALWLMTDGHWVRFDTRTETWRSFRIPYPDLKKLPAFSAAKTPDGSWWIATEKGLLHATPSADTFQFEVFRNNPAERNSPNNDYIASLANDPRDPFVLWLGTKGGGLNRFDIKNKRFQHFTTREGLPDDVIYGIQADAKGNLWLSSNHGLIRFNPATQEIKNYLKVDGLQDFEFNTFSSGVCPNGDLMFGGVNGLNIFSPDEIIDNPVKPQVRFTALKLNNLPINVGGISNPADVSDVLVSDIGFLDHLTVPYAQNNITLEFAALEFTAPSKNRFRFYLEGSEKPWAHETGENFAAYLNLQPGQYVFKVIGSNNDGVWGDAPTTLKITVLPPWYRSVWAYLAYALLFGGAVLWYWRTRENRLRLELALEKKQREAEQTTWALEKEQQEAERAAREFEMARHEAEQIRARDQMQLEEITQNLLEKNQLIASLQAQSQASQDSDALPNPEDVDALYDTKILTRKDWESFKMRFERVYPDFQQQLAERFPDLSEAEFRLMLLLKMGLKTLETAPILAISPESVKKAKQRLRKKLHSQDIMLEDLLNNG